ncbi:hypothetical protein HMI55_003690 [Coelomomyces lativittatus]|nr:hypothetical protein HMI55_003690 [Coelomomyces lativittatus]
MIDQSTSRGNALLGWGICAEERCQIKMSDLLRENRHFQTWRDLFQAENLRLSISRHDLTGTSETYSIRIKFHKFINTFEDSLPLKIKEDNEQKLENTLTIENESPETNLSFPNFIHPLKGKFLLHGSIPFFFSIQRVFSF